MGGGPNPGFSFWVTVCKTFRPMLWDHCLSVLSVVGVLWPNGWMDQDETWHGGRPRPWPHGVGWGSSSSSPKGAQPPIFSPCLLWPNGSIGQDATSYKGRPWPRPHCVRWGPRSSLSHKKGSTAPNFRPVCCGQMVAHLSYC